jgi:hypothetical protein
MRKIILGIVIIITFSGNAQNSDLPKVVGDTLITTSGYKAIVKDDLKLGVGTLPNGNFKYIQTSSASWVTAGGSQITVGKAWSGHLFRIKKIRKQGSDKRGYTYWLVLGGGNIVNYECDIENAIASGEVVVPDEFKPKMSSTIVISNISVSDELVKLKKLLDDGILTKEEYDTQKKKLLSK